MSASPTRIAVIMMENKDWDEIIGASDAPYENALASTYAYPMQMYAITHPSLPNYFAVSGGSTFGIQSNCDSCRIGAQTLVDQLQGRHLSWKAYMESLPHPCFTGAASGEYVKKHDPFVHYSRVIKHKARCRRHIVGLKQLSRDEQHNRLPRFSWITPNSCHDTHDCSVAVGDTFLSQLIPPLLNALGPNGLLVLTWDEGWENYSCCSLAAGGRIPTILAGGLVNRGATLSTPVDQYSILQLIEDLYGLPRKGGAACACTPSMRSLVH